jgi:hypothetical protein
MATRLDYDMNQRIDPTRLSAEIRQWMQLKQFNDVELRETSEPSWDENEDYKLIYCAELLPKKAAQAKLEIHLSDKGNLGLGLETRQRIASHLGVRNHRHGFADGFEPLLLSTDELIRILDLVACGEVTVLARTIPWYGLGATASSVKSVDKTDNADVLRRFYFFRKFSTDLAPLIKTVTFDPWT